MIIVFTSNTNGAMTQMTIHLTKEFVEMGEDAVCFIPSQATVTVPDFLKNKIHTYNKVKTLNIYSKGIRAITDQMMSLKPDYVIYIDNCIISSLVALSIRKKVKQIMTFHDAGFNHPSNDNSFKMKLHSFVEDKLSRRAAYKITNVMVMSAESECSFKQHYPKAADKTILVPLGAHIPDAEEVKPEETMPDEYILFFGRIDKYKGIGNLLNAYANDNMSNIPLVIAGKGELSEKEAELSRRNEVILLNRYISDGEMIWLFKNSKFVVLPYIQATQSGIIPIAYSYGIPVITSDVPGLTQFVIDGKTGYICSDPLDYATLISKMWNQDLQEMSDNCKSYYMEKLDWKNNVRNLIKRMEMQQ